VTVINTAAMVITLPPPPAAHTGDAWWFAGVDKEAAGRSVCELERRRVGFLVDLLLLERRRCR
jgi:hypothetical protein